VGPAHLYSGLYQVNAKPKHNGCKSILHYEFKLKAIYLDFKTSVPIKLPKYESKNFNIFTKFKLATFISKHIYQLLFLIKNGRYFNTA